MNYEQVKEIMRNKDNFRIMRNKGVRKKDIFLTITNVSNIVQGKKLD